jgi:hypothetical protein
MFPGNGSVVAGNSGRPQLENGDGSIPFSGHGGAGGCSEPTGANTCWCQIARCVAISLEMVGIRIGLAEAAAAPPAATAAATAIAPITRALRLFI